MLIPSVVISLESRPDRLSRFRAQFRDELAVPKVILADEGHPMKDGSRLSVGQVGCWNSHLLAYRVLLESSHSHILVFEDDAVISQEGLNFVFGLSPTQMESIDLLQLGYLTHFKRIDFLQPDPVKYYALDPAIYCGSDMARLDAFFRNWLRSTRFMIRFLGQLMMRCHLSSTRSSRLIRYCSNEKRLRLQLRIPLPLVYHSFEPGSHAYIISRNLAEYILKSKNWTFLPVDAYFMALAKNRHFSCIRLSKSLVAQDDSASSIKEDS